MRNETKARRIARYQKLLKTLRECEKLLVGCKYSDPSEALASTRKNIATVESQLAIWKSNT